MTTRAEAERAMRQAQDAADTAHALVYRERLADARWIDVDTSRFPSYAPTVRVVGKLGRTLSIDEVPAAELARVAAVKAEIERWWLDGGAWPVSPAPDRKITGGA